MGILVFGEFLVENASDDDQICNVARFGVSGSILVQLVPFMDQDEVMQLVNAVNRKLDLAENEKCSLQGKYPIGKLQFEKIHVRKLSDWEEKFQDLKLCNDQILVFVSVENRDLGNQVLEDWSRIFPDGYRAVVSGRRNSLKEDLESMSFEQRFICKPRNITIAPVQSHGIDQDSLIKDSKQYYAIPYSEFQVNRTRRDKVERFSLQDILENGSLHMIRPEAWMAQIAYLHYCLDKYGA
jgi:hypothetical protein